MPKPAIYHALEANSISPYLHRGFLCRTNVLYYQDAGLELVIQALRWEPKKLQRHAYKLLRRREEARVKQALREYQPWDLFERLQEYRGYKGLHAERFANRLVVDYNPEVGIEDPANTAYALRWDWDGVKRSSTEGNRPFITEQIASLLEDSQASKLEALIFGLWDDDTEIGSYEIVDELLTSELATRLFAPQTLLLNNRVH